MISWLEIYHFNEKELHSHTKADIWYQTKCQKKNLNNKNDLKFKITKKELKCFILL